jgi:hypothetical protein
MIKAENKRLSNWLDHGKYFSNIIKILKILNRVFFAALFVPHLSIALSSICFHSNDSGNGDGAVTLLFTLRMIQ